VFDGEGIKVEMSALMDENGISDEATAKEV